MKRFSLVILLPLFLLNCGSTQQALPDATVVTPPRPIIGSQAKNIILMIGDGMGLTQISAGIYDNNNYLNFERFPIIGLMKTHSYNNLVTDSAAGGTAMASGVKTYNNGVGVDKDGVPVKSILEEAEEANKMTGVVVTSSVVNATPAAFMAHQRLRAFSEPIAEEIANSGVDFLVGGGKRYFDRRDSDDRNLYQEMSEKGYQMTDFIENQKLSNIKFKENQKFVYFTADDVPLSHIAGRDYLATASLMGAKFLKERSENGFFMMIEGSQIDLGGHATNLKYVLSELKDFDSAIEKILDFAEADGETLVIVTADHETGGLTIKEGSKMNKIKADFSYGRHSAALVPVFAYGPGAENFSGVFDNTQLYKKMKSAMKLGEK